jgi:uncharacterized DUF497 family protein
MKPLWTTREAALAILDLPVRGPLPLRTVLGKATFARGAQVCIPSGVGFEWDAEKARANLRKHKVDLADAATVLDDEMAITIRDEDPDEDRFVTVGADALSRVLVVAYTCAASTFVSSPPGEQHPRNDASTRAHENEEAVRFQQGQAWTARTDSEAQDPDHDSTRR